MAGPFSDRKFNAKSDARDTIWQALTEQKLARFPFPVRGRIPNYKGAEAAALNLFTLGPWKDAKLLKINPDSPQRPVRIEALRRGITYFMPTPRLKAGFRKFDPAKIPSESYREAAALSTSKKWGELVALDDMPQVDAIVTGSVAVTRDGKRCGKGEGYSDIEFAILRELGHKAVPAATTVHDIMIVGDFPWDEIDLPLSAIATPDGVIKIPNPYPAPDGIDWSRLSERDLEDMPVLKELKTLKF
jgi:5-formyltetrahydrofolate cyclo-ligase